MKALLRERFLSGTRCHGASSEVMWAALTKANRKDHWGAGRILSKLNQTIRKKLIHGFDHPNGEVALIRSLHYVDHTSLMNTKLLGTRASLLVTKDITTRCKYIATSNKDATRNTGSVFWSGQKHIDDPVDGSQPTVGCASQEPATDSSRKAFVRRSLRPISH